MNKAYIMRSTPRQIVEENTVDEIGAAFDSYVTGSNRNPDFLFDGTCPDEYLDEDFTTSNCEQLLVEWYDERDAERECTAEELVIAYKLHVAWYVKVNQEMEVAV